MEIAISHVEHKARDKLLVKNQQNIRLITTGETSTLNGRGQLDSKRGQMKKLFLLYCINLYHTIRYNA